jgi:hypothetical protein
VNYLRMLMRAKRLVQHPPSRRQIVIFAVVMGASLLLIGIETFVGWPDWLTVDQGRLEP